MVTLLFRSQLYALQLLDYNLLSFLAWIARNPFRLRLEKKKKLVYTGKAKTLLHISTIIPLLLATTALFGFMTGVIGLRSSLILVTSIVAVYLAAPWICLTIALLIIKVYEIPNGTKTINEARKVLSRNPNLTVIGITGSYGKTTVKEMLRITLSKKYNVLSTPKSFNTLFGIAKIVKEQLKPEHQIFIVEMGAYKRGEIAELCRMVKPGIGILTGITNQHLERFGSEENIIRGKYELIEALPANGLAVFNLYSKPCCDLYQKTSIPKIGYSRVEKPHGLVPDLWTQVTKSYPTGSIFDLKINNLKLNSSQSLQNLTLNLPAEHNVSNALAAIAVALFLKVNPENIRQAVSEIKTTEHRLQVLSNPDGTVIIDDAYSSNTEGAHAAINLVKKFTNKPKIIVTPGLIELGKKQFEENKNFGKLIAENFDYAVIVNKTNRQALLSGLLAGGWLFLNHTLVEHLGFTANQLENYNVPEEIDERIFVVNSLEEATRKIIPNLVKSGSLILFENDLPDIYD